jgi:GNAT superfamily N-acetyltransferase
MLDNPTHERVFGSDRRRRARRLSKFYARVLPRLHRRATILGAYRDGALIGVLAVAKPGRCQPSLLEQVRLLPAFLYGVGPTVPLRLMRWMKAWARHDLPEPHWHLGPAAIDAPHQNQGIGSSLLPRVCDWLDQRGATAYLETERRSNVRLYERFGFVVRAEATVLDVRCWFMSRSPRTVPDRDRAAP